MVLIFAEVHPFGSVTAEPITVDIVSPSEAPPVTKEEPLPSPQPMPSESTEVLSKPAASSSPAPSAPPPAAPQQAAAKSQKPAAPAVPRPDRQAAAAQIQPQPKPSATSSAPAYVPPEPDLSLKYHVMLGLPPELPAAKAGSNDFDAPASKQADVASSLVTEFRRRLKTCSKLPGSIEPSDNIQVMLRVFMSADGTLESEPILIEASASAKGPALMQGAIRALQACQPYSMLPADRYGEWKVLDLSFTPRDFSGG